MLKLWVNRIFTSLFSYDRRSLAQGAVMSVCPVLCVCVCVCHRSKKCLPLPISLPIQLGSL